MIHRWKDYKKIWILWAHVLERLISFFIFGIVNQLIIRFLILYRIIDSTIRHIGTLVLQLAMMIFFLKQNFSVRQNSLITKSLWYAGKVQISIFIYLEVKSYILVIQEDHWVFYDVWGNTRQWIKHLSKEKYNFSSKKNLLEESVFSATT